MEELRKRRLTKEVQERVIMNDGNIRESFQDVLNHLYKEHELYFDNDRHVQAINTMNDITTLKEMMAEYNETTN